MPNIFKVYFFVLMISLFTACQNNHRAIDIAENIQLESVRFDRALMHADTSNIDFFVDSVSNLYPRFFNTYTNAVLGIGGPQQKMFFDYLKAFIANDISRSVYLEIQNKFPETEQVSQDISEAFSHYHYYFPKHEVPQLFYFQSGFNQRVFIDSGVVAVALDMSLGEDNAFYQQLAMPNYMRQKMVTETIALDVMRGLLWSDFEFKENEYLAANMVYEGMIQYALNYLFPNLPENACFPYSEEQWNWLLKNEKLIWSSVLDQEMLYQTDRMKIKNMMSDAPFTQQFGNQSPAKIGVWLGWRIVSEYMEEHPELSLNDLMHQTDYIAILNESGYRP
ncbi:MAG: hypothetical protein JXR60_04905 [Bacteroidales bacterium]|nr:hypothetical protein [Bacteroidales bacterium]